MQKERSMGEKNTCVNNKSLSNEYIDSWYCWKFAIVQATCTLPAKYYELFTDIFPSQGQGSGSDPFMCDRKRNQQ